jgi:hypothetical protein
VLIRLKLKIELLSSPFSIFQKTPKKTGYYYLQSPFSEDFLDIRVVIISILHFSEDSKEDQLLLSPFSISSEDFLDIRGRYQNALTLHNLLKAQSTMVVHNLLLEKLDGYQYDPCHSYPATRVNLLKFIDLNPPLESTLSVKRLASSDL